MITRAKIKLECEKLPSNIGVYLHAYLFSELNTEYANEIHNINVKPFSQYVSYENGEYFWNISTLDEKCYENLLIPLLDKTQNIKIHSKNLTIKLSDKNVIYRRSYRDFVDEFFKPVQSDKLNLKFITTTSFKVNETHLIFPSIEHIIYSIANKFNTFSKDTVFEGAEVFDEIRKNLTIFDYRLSTKNYEMKKVMIKGFQGDFTLKLSKVDYLSSVLNLLLHFGEFSGVGIKTALGMGGFKYL